MTDGQKVVEVSRNGASFNYGDNPWRKSKTLSVMVGNAEYPVAYFRNQEAFDLFCTTLETMFGTPIKEG